MWSNLSQWGLQRSISDHYAVMLKEKDVNWGPKPFRFLNCWKQMTGYVDFVKDQWRDIVVEEGKHMF